MINKEFLLSACDSVFNTDTGRKAESEIRKTINNFSMMNDIQKGVIVGFSGGADSVLLLIFLLKLRKEANFNLKAIHINHLIRGTDADNDEKFCREFCKALDIDFSSYRMDVPKIANEEHLGLEEAARNIRYKCFEEVLKNCDKFKTIVTAHNATDNLETFIFNLMRGTGSCGLSAISPIRKSIIRPMLSVPKEDITKVLSDAKIPFVTDKTNFSTEYTRNYIRHEILPKFKRLSPSPELSCKKAIDSLRSDDEYISAMAYQFYIENVKDGKIDSNELVSLHFALYVRVLRLMIKEKSPSSPEKVHIDKIFNLLSASENFEVALPGGISFYCRYGICYIDTSSKKSVANVEIIPLKNGFNEIPILDIAIGISDNKNEDFSSNVYKIAIQADLQSAIILGELRVRTKRDGDSYYYGGITRKVKKLFNDKKISPEDRNRIPIICDEKGIVWIPGFGVRDDLTKTKKHRWITIYKKR